MSTNPLQSHLIKMTNNTFNALRRYCCQTPRYTNTFQLQGLCFPYFVLLAYFFVWYGELLLQDAASLQGNTKSLPHLRGMLKHSHPFVSHLQKSVADMYAKLPQWPRTGVVVPSHQELCGVQKVTSGLWGLPLRWRLLQETVLVSSPPSFSSCVHAETPGTPGAPARAKHTCKWVEMVVLGTTSEKKCDCCLFPLCIE